MALWLLFIVFIGIRGSSIPLELNSEMYLQILDKNGTQNYILTLNSTQVSAEHLIVFELNSKDDSDPDIYISKKNYPTPSLYEWSCSALGSDVCIVPVAKIFDFINNSFPQLYATVYCSSKCNYSIKVSSQNSYQLKDGHIINEVLTSNDFRVYSFYMPQDELITSVKFVLKVNVYDQDKIIMMIHVPTPEGKPTFEKRPLPTYEGYGLKFFKHDGEFCIDCQYKISIQTMDDIELEYSILVVTSSGVISITQENNYINDIVNLREQNCYLYSLTDLTKNLWIQYNGFSGEVNLDVTQVNSTLSKPYNASKIKNYEFKISPSEHKSGIYKCCIYGNFISSYSFYIFEGENSIFHLSYGVPFSSKIEHGELELFVYFPQIYKADNITISLNSIFGNADLYVKFCKVQWSFQESHEPYQTCSIQLDKLNDSEVIASNNIIGTDIVTIKNKGKDCPQDYSCYFSIGIYGIDKNINFYTLEAHDNYFSIVQLVEGKVYNGQVKNGEYNYFMFHNPDSLVSEIAFQLTDHQGDCDLYASRNYTLVNASIAEKGSQKTSYFPDTIIYNNNSDGNLEGTIYLSVYGYSASSYSLTVALRRALPDSNSIVRSNIEISQGEVIKELIPSDKLGVYFQIPQAPGFYMEEEEILYDIKIILNPEPQDVELLIYVGDGYIPKPDKFRWTNTMRNMIYIKKNSTIQGKLFLLVLKPKKYANETTSFTLTYSTQQYSVEINEGIEFHNIVQKKSFDYYKFPIFDSSENISISLTQLTGKCDLYVSTNPFNQLPDNTNFSHFLMTDQNGEGSISLTKEDLFSYSHCNNSTFTSLCKIYLGVTSSSESCFYSISILTSNLKVSQISEGIPREGTLQYNSETFFYMDLNSPKALDISLSTLLSEVHLYLRILPYKQNKKRDLKLPSPHLFDFEGTKEVNRNQILLDINQTKNCSQGCTLVFGIYVDPVYYGTLPSDIHYTFSASSTKLMLAEGKSLYDKIEYINVDLYKDYYFNILCQNCTFTISLVPLSNCNPDLYISYGADAQPRQNSYDFASRSLFGEYITIYSNDSFFTSSSKTFASTYSVSVFADLGCSYSIGYINSLSDLTEINIGSSLNIIQQTRFRTFRYLNKKENITLNWISFKGDFKIRGLYYTTEEIKNDNFLPIIPTQDKQARWIQDSYSSTGIVIKKNDSNYKENAFYMFTVECMKVCSYGIILQQFSLEKTVFDIIQLGNPVEEVLAQGAKSGYALMISMADQITISTNALSGQYQVYVSNFQNVSEKHHKWTAKENQPIIIDLIEEKDLGKGIFYILIVSKTYCHFVLNAKQSIGPSQIKEGIPINYFFNSESKIGYFYYDFRHEFVDNKPIKVGFSLKVLSEKFNPLVYVSLLYNTNISVDNFPDHTYYDYFYNVSGMSHKLTSDIYTIDPNKHQVIAITIQSRNSFAEESISQIQMTFFSGVSTKLSSGIEIESKFNRRNDTQIFEIDTSNLVSGMVTLSHCKGEFDLNLFKKLDQGGTEESPKEIIKTSSFITKIKIPNPHGRYYIKISNKDVYSNEKRFPGETIYNLLYEAKNDSSEFSIENEGRIDLYIYGNSIRLYWGRIIRKLSNKETQTLIDSQIKYSLYISYDLNAHIDSECGIRNSEVIPLEEFYSKNEYAFTPKRNEDFYFNVLAWSDNGKNIMSYHPILIQKGSFPYELIKTFWKIYLMAILLGTILAGFLFYYYRRRNVSHDYELQDFRRVSNRMNNTENVSITQ